MNAKDAQGGWDFGRHPVRNPSFGIGLLDAYDAGLLNDYGGGDVEWWQNYIRDELERAHDFYQSQVDGTDPTTTEANQS